MGLIGYIALAAIVVFGPVELDFWTEFGILLVGAGALLRD